MVKKNLIKLWRLQRLRRSYTSIAPLPIALLKNRPVYLTHLLITVKILLVNQLNLLLPRNINFNITPRNNRGLKGVKNPNRNKGVIIHFGPIILSFDLKGLQAVTGNVALFINRSSILVLL